MSSLSGEIGQHKIEFESAPTGTRGTVAVKVGGVKYNVTWNMDRSGIWIELPSGVSGFDLQMDIADDGKKSYTVVQRGFAREWNGLHFTRAGEKEAASGDAGKKKSARVKSQMPGKIVRILVKVGDLVAKDQPLIVMEAMKMENEIKATQAGKVSKISVSEAQALETGTELLVIEAV